MRTSILLAVLILFMSAAALAKDSGITVTVKNAQGESLGTVAIKPAVGGVALKLDLHGLAPGGHAIHFHQNAKCEGPDFKSAGPHFNPHGKKHGLDNPEGAHAGDMLNFTVDAKGKATGAILNKNVDLGSGPNSLYANGGTSLVIHAKPDDMKTDPAGNAGDRIACGIVAK